ncbi:efflux RND transporter periplasmic adaptor subunit [Nitrosospira sp. Is2]|uniref:efflux RND transporter periplasmic adaptor subunit n=1 Tax=Nitrosospira sp. Is2 TaxID=3080532 RepID=UPI002954C3A2|nr:efflux RND transporter periplasmic adaptor subunit [Nitrosospira sp. Is2]WON73461.1 efflux RND transporter periplasmic adaptor subunit [Nitrosospira sp. Is2]
MRAHHIIRLFKPLSLVALLAVFIAGCSKGGKPPDAAAPVPEVSVATVVSKRVYQWDEFTGRIAAIDTVELRARVSGYIDRIAFKEGDEVKVGDLLFVIDPRPYRIALDSAQAQLERAHSSAQFAHLQERRAQPLIEDQAISRQEYDQRTTNLTQGNADVRAAEAAVASARLNLDFTQVRSPITGRIGRALLTVGNLAQADESVLTTVVSQDPVYVYFQPDEQTYLRYAELARKGERPGSANPVRVGLASDTGYPYTGTVNFVSNQVDPATGTISARAVVPNPDRVFTPGLYARVQLQGSGEFAAILIDDKAVMTDQDRKYVYVLGLENKATRKDITLGGVIDGLRIVKSGLEPNDKVIVAGLQKILFPGAPVKPNEVPMAAPPAAAGTR